MDWEADDEGKGESSLGREEEERNAQVSMMARTNGDKAFEEVRDAARCDQRGLYSRE